MRLRDVFLKKVTQEGLTKEGGFAQILEKAREIIF